MFTVDPAGYLGWLREAAAQVDPISRACERASALANVLIGLSDYTNTRGTSCVLCENK